MRWRALLLTSASRQLQRQGNRVTSETLFREFPVAAWGAAESPREPHCGAVAARAGSNMSVSEACSARLLLVLTAWALADANTTAPVTTTDTKQQIHETVSHHAGLQQTTSTPEPTFTVQTKNPVSSITLTEHRINITAGPSIAEKNIMVEKPMDLDLWCSLPINSSLKTEIIDVVWEFNNRTLREHNISRSDIKSSWCSLHTVQVRHKDAMGSYTCSFKTGKELHGYGTFHVKVPEIEGHSKHTISYVGDIVALTCKTGNYTPLYWAWYTKNGSEEVAINQTLMPEKYKISQKYANDTKLMVHSLSEKDDGIYWCKVVFELGESHRSGSLKVLTYMAPLKPFLAIAAEVLIFVTLIFVYEVYSKKKDAQAGKKLKKNLNKLSNCKYFVYLYSVKMFKETMNEAQFKSKPFAIDGC
ncbi:hypothetical protein lerEdw1_000438 [Lerista edwardsae]|nr:hypothetical protein lerEdw1_000438 [Lerista edwardsae]